jgi:hypothetical protein
MRRWNSKLNLSQGNMAAESGGQRAAKTQPRRAEHFSSIIRSTSCIEGQGNNTASNVGGKAKLLFRKVVVRSQGSWKLLCVQLYT